MLGAAKDPLNWGSPPGPAPVSNERVEVAEGLSILEGLVASIDGVCETAVFDGDRSHKVAGNAHVCIEGVEGEALLFLLDRVGVSASAASACASGAAEPRVSAKKRAYL